MSTQTTATELAELLANLRNTLASETSKMHIADNNMRHFLPQLEVLDDIIRDLSYSFAGSEMHDAAYLVRDYIGAEVVRNREASIQAEDEVHHLRIAIECVERTGEVDYPHVRLAALEEDAPF
jgi:hypothetical protein